MQTILRFFDLHPWFLPSVAAIVTIVVVLYKVSKAVIRRMYPMIVNWLQDRYDAKTFAAMPWQSIKLEPFAKVLKTSRKKLLLSMRRLRDQGKVISIRVDELDEEEVWRKI